MSIHSRATLLLQKELYKISLESLPWGIKVEIVKNNLFHWKCTIEGSLDTPWEGGIFKLELFFSQDYNDVPPEAVFTTVPFHPNVDLYTGRLCFDFFDDILEWNPNFRIPMMLAQIQTMLCFPTIPRIVPPKVKGDGLECRSNVSEEGYEISDGEEEELQLPIINHSAMNLFLKSPRLYNQLIGDAVIASRRIHAGLAPYEEEAESDEERTSENRIIPKQGSNDDSMYYISKINKAKNTTKVEYYKPKPDVTEDKGAPLAKISFEAYHHVWAKYATSIPGDVLNNNITALLDKSKKHIAFHRNLDAVKDAIKGKTERPTSVTGEDVYTDTDKIEMDKVIMKYTKPRYIKSTNFFSLISDSESYDMSHFEAAEKLYISEYTNQKKFINSLTKLKRLKNGQLAIFPELPNKKSPIVINKTAKIAEINASNPPKEDVKKSIAEEIDEHEADALLDWSTQLDQKNIDSELQPFPKPLLSI